MLEGNRIRMAQGENPCYLLLNQANRHGLIAGASGTGKTVTFKVMAEGLSQAGVPIFMADVKGDVAGMAQAGVDNEGMQKRIAKFGIEGWSYRGCPVRLWDIAGTAGAGDAAGETAGGIPVRVPVSDMGPTMLARLLGLTDVQEGVLDIVFSIADDNRWLLIDLKDLRAMLNYVAEHADAFQTTYGNVSSQSVGAILRALISVENEGGDAFFGEPGLNLSDWFACDENGHGYVNILNAVRLVQSPQIYSMFLLWMLSELYNTLPEVGDPDKPVFAFFFDEAHLLFNDMPKELLDKIVQIVKLVRSKGVGVYFISQSPSDIPDKVLAQLSNRVQHGLRAYTPAELKVAKAAAQAFRENPSFKAEEAILELGTGEALVSFLDEDGKPCVVENAKILPPQCLMAAPSGETLAACYAAQADLHQKYARAVDPVSAFEIISGADGATASAAATAPAATGEWTCTCGAVSESKFCPECGTPRPAGAQAGGAEWTCSCGTVTASKFCPECGTPRPASAAAAVPLPSKESLAAQEKAAKEAEKEAVRLAKEAEKEAARQAKEAEREEAAARKAAEKAAAEKAKREAQLQREVVKTASSIIGQIGRTAGSSIVRGILGSMKK